MKISRSGLLYTKHSREGWFQNDLKARAERYEIGSGLRLTFVSTSKKQQKSHYTRICDKNLS